MKFTRLHSIIIIALVLLSLAGLSFIQFSWLSGAMALREEKIQEQVSQVMENLQVILDIQLAGKGHFQAERSHGSEQIALLAKHSLDSILQQEQMLMPYEYGFTSCKSGQYDWFSDRSTRAEIMEGFQMQLSNCSTICR